MSSGLFHPVREAEFLNLGKPCGASSKNFIFAPLFAIKITLCL